MHVIQIVTRAGSGTKAYREVMPIFNACDGIVPPESRRD